MTSSGYCCICKKPIKHAIARFCETCGIKATDNKTGQEFFFHTDLQSDAENAMSLMGYGCSDYGFSFFENRSQPMDA
jgi:predicted amidophosphoribosyltransferase